MDQDAPIGERVRYWRNRRNMSQQVLAGLVGRSSQWLSKVERGKLSFDSISVLLALARVLKVEPAVLWGGISLPPTPPLCCAGRPPGRHRDAGVGRRAPLFSWSVL